MKKSRLILLLLPLLVVACSDNDSYTPKPRGYFRIDLPEREYEQLETDCPYSFEINTSAEFNQQQNCWATLSYPGLDAQVQLTYKDVKENKLEDLLQEGSKLAYKHVVKADGIREKLFTDTLSDVHGILYQIQGEAATSTQFYMTDSTEHYLRGVLYFYAEPNVDSLKPANEFMYGEIIHLIETLEWQNSSP
jgi:gliding motility-associated lipoprotein GldD